MNFRLVWMGPVDDQPERPSSVHKSAAALPHFPSGTPRYEQRGTEMVRPECLEKGRLKCIAVANFTARIVRDLVRDDDDEPRRDFEIQAELGGQTCKFVVPAAAFGRMGWVLNKLGPEAIIYPGQQQHARAAIQWLSGPIRQVRSFTHLGWRKHGPDWLYLHAGGAVGAQGPRTDLQGELPTALQQYKVQGPADRKQQQ